MADEPLHLEEVDYDPFANAPADLQEVDYDPFQPPAQAQVPVITVHPRSADRPVSQEIEDRRGEPGSWAAALGLPRWSDVTDAIAHPLTPQVPSELPMPATAGQLPHAAGLDDIQVPPEQPGFLDRLSALRERLRAAAPSSPQDFVTRQLTNLASVPGQIDTMTQAAHHLMMEPPLPPPKGSYTLDDGLTYPGTSDPAAWQAFAADQQARAETGPATALGMIGGGVPVVERGAAGIAGGRLAQPGYAAQAEEFLPKGAPSGPVLAGDPRLRGSMNPLDEIPFTFNGKNPNQWTPEEFQEVGEKFGVPNLGPLSPLKTFKDETGRTFTVPGGTEGNFTYYDLLHLKSQGIDASKLPMDLHKAIQQKIVRTMTPEPSDAQNWSGLTFGMTSPNNPLFPNQLAQSRLRLRDPAFLQQVADMVPWKAGEAVGTEARQAASNRVASALGLDAAEKGGLGVRGSTDYSRVADLAKMFLDRPDFFRKGADEPWGQFVERISSQVPGLQMKTGSFGSVWQDPARAGVSAIDRHMVSEFEKSGGLFPTPQARQAFEQRAVTRWNTANKKSPDKQVESFDQLQKQSGWDGFRNKMLLEEVGGAPTKQFRMKGGEINPDIPEYLRTADWAVEPRTVQTMSEPYQRALDWNAQHAEQQGLSLFPSQWLMWDRIRHRLEPHENMFPGLERMPAMSKDQLREVADEHRASGHMDYTKTAEGFLRPTKPRPNPARFGYFALPPAIAAGAIGSQSDARNGGM